MRWLCIAAACVLPAASALAGEIDAWRKDPGERLYERRQIERSRSELDRLRRGIWADGQVTGEERARLNAADRRNQRLKRRLGP